MDSPDRDLSLAGNAVPLFGSPAARELPETYEPGSERDFVRLYEREALRLTRTIFAILGNRQDAEDCVQEAFARAYRDWAQWRPTAPARFWVQRIAINLALSRRRHQKLAAIKHLLLPHPSLHNDQLADNMDLMACLQKLPIKQLTVVLMRFNHGYNNREIAEALDITDRAVGLRMQAGLQKLNELMTASNSSAPRPFPS